jgi:EAL domain-containing protein (putative c-di-GMP-specific phosphodiesterase class I)
MDLLDPPAMLAVDDTGSGYASLRHVLELRPHFVKLEPSFVHEIDRDETRQAMVAGMVHYAAENETRLIAEGIETEAERKTLLRLGVRFGQGYLLGVPSASGAVSPQRNAAGSRRLRALDDASGDSSVAG